jgi:cytochrome c oxidase assembly protein subunit 15
MPQDLYDFAPVLKLLLTGGTLALVPLAWVWLKAARSGSEQRWRALSRLTLFLVFDLVLFGAFTRLTDSGLGCPDWPGCYGNASPLGARHDIAVAEAALPDGPVTTGKAWIEMIHRYFATSLGALITVMMVAAWVLRRRGGAISPAWATATFVWVCVQGLFGALTVTMKLNPGIVTLHLLGGYLGLALLTLQSRAPDAPRQPLSRGLRQGVLAVLVLVWVQSALGGWVSTNYAVMACSEVPRCQGKWWPAMDFASGFTLVRDLGRLPDGRYLPFEALIAIHMVHRLAAVVVLAALTALAWALWRRPVPARRYGQGLLALAALQLVTGLSNVILDWPIVAALLHTGGAGAMVVVLTALRAATRDA